RTVAVHQGGDLLHTGTRSADHAHRAAADHVSEAERDAADDSSTAIRAHEEEGPLDGELLERLLVVDGDIVAEEHNVQAELEGLARFGGGIKAGSGDERQGRAGQESKARGQGVRRL